MNTRTQKALIEFLATMKTVALFSETKGSRELYDAAQEALEAVLEDDTVVETGMSNKE